MEVFTARIAKEAAEIKARMSQPDSFTPPPWDMAGQELPPVKQMEMRPSDYERMLGKGGVR